MRRRRRWNRVSISEVLSQRDGRKAVARFKRFWGVRQPPSAKRLSIPGGKGRMVLVGLGRSPAVNLANGPKGKATKFRRIRHRGILATDSSGKRLFILSGRSSNSPTKRMKFVGYAHKTEYVPTPALEKQRTFKARKHWIHSHSDAGGSWPKVYRDQSGNYHYSRGSYRVTKWIHK